MPPLLLRPAPLRSLLTTLARPFSTTPPNRIAKITIVGRVGAAPELTLTSTGHEIIKYVVGTGHGPIDNRQTSWWRVASFAEEGKGRDRILGLGKGTLVYLEGEAKMTAFENKEGQKQSSVNIVQQRLEVLKRPGSHTEDVEES